MIIKISRTAFNEIVNAVNQEFGTRHDYQDMIDMDGVVLQAEEEKPSVLKLALKEGLKKDGNSTSE
jgi:hypothetical protein